MRLVSNVILAKLLFPEAFGLMALVAVIIQGSHMLSDFGLQQLVIQNKDGDEPRFLDVIWTVQLFRGCILWGVTFLVAPYIADFYSSPDLEWIIPTVGLISILSGVNTTGVLTARRHMQLDKISIIEICAQAASTVLMITVAVIKPSVLALVVGPLVSYTITLFLSYRWLGKRMNKLAFDSNVLKEIVRFGKWIFLSTMLTFAVGQGDKLAFGTIVSLEMLGVYSIALVLATLPVNLFGQLGQSVIYPAYCREIGSEEFFAVFHRIRDPFVILGAFALSLLFLLAPAIVSLLYDERYSDATWMLQILLVGGIFRLLEQPNGSALLASGNARKVAEGSAAKLVIMFLFIWVGFEFYGFFGAVVGFSLSEIARYIVSTHALRSLSIGTVHNDAMTLFVWLTITAAGVHTQNLLMVNEINFVAATFLAALTLLLLWGLTSLVLWQKSLEGPVRQLLDELGKNLSSIGRQ